MRFFTKKWWRTLFNRIRIFLGWDPKLAPISRTALDIATDSRLVSSDGVKIEEVEMWTESSDKDRSPSCDDHDYRKIKLKVTPGVAKVLKDGFKVEDFVCANCTHGKRTINKKITKGPRVTR